MEKYRKLYATLAGQVDKAITVLDGMIEQQEFDWFHIVQTREILRAALLEAEARYIEDAEDEEDGTDFQLIVLPPRKQ